MLKMCSVGLFDLKNIGIDTITMSIGVQVIGKNLFFGGHFQFLNGNHWNDLMLTTLFLYQHIQKKT